MNAPSTRVIQPPSASGTHRVDLDDFVGTWRLVAFETRVSDGRVIQRFGPDAEGLITYTPDGRAWVFVAKAERPHFASLDMTMGTPEEYTAAMRTYIHYTATVEIDAENQEVLHHVDGSLFPNWKGGVQRRFFQFSDDGNYLELSTTEVPSEGATAVGVLAWERLATT